MELALAHAHDHVYTLQLSEVDPLADQPERILVPLKPHQRASLQKAMTMERNGSVNYFIEKPPTPYSFLNYKNNIKVKTNVGVLADIVGYGKTLTALSIIAATPSADIHHETSFTYSFQARQMGHFTAITDRVQTLSTDKFINSTLVVVPRGPVFVQWQTALKNQTTLKHLTIDGIAFLRKHCPPRDSSFEVIQAFMNQYDVVLIKSTSFDTFQNYYNAHEGLPDAAHPLYGWNRIMIDEAHEIIRSVDALLFRFLWIITGTPELLPYHGHGENMSIMAEVLGRDRMLLMMLRNEKNFVMNSFSVPLIQEHTYLCALSAEISALHAFFAPAVLDRINANDMQGAIELMGGSCETETDIVKLVTKDVLRDIKNKSLEIDHVTLLDIPEATRAAMLETHNGELKRLQDKHAAIVERVNDIRSQDCSICYDKVENPIFLTCTHTFCGSCIVAWMRNRGRVCPTCRDPIASSKLIGVVNEKPPAAPETAAPLSNAPISKEAQVIKVIKDKPDGKFLVFTHYDRMFSALKTKMCEAEITVSELKGTTHTMTKILERFKSGETKVLLIDSSKFAAGIDISFATDVIMVHNLKHNREQCIARAQRVGRTSALHVHQLFYPHEM